MLINYSEKTRTRRFASKMVKPKKVKASPDNLRVILPKRSGRLNGRVTVRHQGGRHKRFYRLIDFKRDKYGVEGVVEAVEYDPNRTVSIALVHYIDGEKRFILAPKGLKVKDKVISSLDKIDINVGSVTKLKNLPIGTVVHNVELIPGAGGQIGRSAGAGLVLQSKEGLYANLKLPSGEVRKILSESLATIGILGNEEWKNINFGKAGRMRHMGIRPTVRGTAQDPRSHAHGGGEGRSGIGRKRPMTKYGRPAVGKTRVKNKWTDKFIVKRRK